MNKIFFIICWYKGDIYGHLHCGNKGNIMLFNDRNEAFSYLEELKHRNPDYEFTLFSSKSEEEVKIYE